MDKEQRTGGNEAPPRRSDGGKRRAVLTVIGCALLYFSVSGIAVNCRGVFFTSMAASFGVSLSRLTLYILISGIASAVLMNPMCALFQKQPTIRVLLPFTLIHTGALVLMGCTDSLPFFYVVSTVQGILNGFLVYYPIQYAIGNWFPDRKGTLLGLVLMTAGLAGTLMNPVLEFFIRSWGWRKAFIAAAGLIGVLSVFPAFVIRKDPGETGDLPVKAGGGAAKKGPAPRRGLDRAGLTVPLIVMIAVISLFAGLSQQYPAIAETLGRRSRFGALLVSAAMIGNMICKPLFGISNDRLGIAKTVTFSMLAGALGVLGTATGRDALMLIGSFLFGVYMPMETVAPPLMFEAYFTEAVKARVYPHVCSVIIIVSSVSQPFLSLTYEVFGSYRPVLWLTAAAFAACVPLVLYYQKKTDPSGR